MNVPTITCQELSQRLEAGDPLLLLDVREPEELQISRLESVLNIPLLQLPTRMGEIDPTAEIVVICRTGNRSGQATSYLRTHGFEKVHNLAGGMNRWAEEIDSKLPVY